MEEHENESKEDDAKQASDIDLSKFIVKQGGDAKTNAEERAKYIKTLQGYITQKEKELEFLQNNLGHSLSMSSSIYQERMVRQYFEPLIAAVEETIANFETGIVLLNNKLDETDEEAQERDDTARRLLNWKEN